MSAPARDHDRGDWRDRAACLGARPDVFFPKNHHAVFAEPAKDYCRRCPAIRDCLAYALLNAVAGVWGGTTDDERDALRRRHGITARPVNVRLPSDSLFNELEIADQGGVSSNDLARRLGVTQRTVIRHRAARRSGTEVRPKRGNP